MLENIENKTIKINFKDEKYKLPKALKGKIDKFFLKCKEDNPSLFNGELICVSEYKKDDNFIEIICQKTKYSHHLYDERVGISKKYACTNLVAGCLFETIDNYYIVGEMSPNTSYPNGLQIIGGNVDNNDIKDNIINIFNTITRECREELNINIEDKKIINEFKLKYISLPNEKTNAYFIIAKAKLKITKKEMLNYYEAYLKYLKDNNLEIEFIKLHFIDKTKVEEELNKLKNNKRSYLKELLEIDSSNKKIKS